MFTAPTTVANLVGKLRERANKAAEQFDSWKKRLNDNPIYAFEWGMQGIVPAITVRVATQALAILASEAKNADGDADAIKLFKAAVVKEMIKSTRLMTDSGDACSDIVGKQTAKEWADLADKIELDFLL